MPNNKKNITNFPNLIRFKETHYYEQALHSVSLFPYNNNHLSPNFFKIILNFSLKEVAFNKKKALPFFLAMELLSNQKCVATLSSKNIMVWKLRKGSLVGCKVTLRKNNLHDFLDNVTLALPRMEKFQGILINKLENQKTNSFSLTLSELVLFYPIEMGLGINTEVKKIELNFIFNTLSLEEKIFLLTSNKIPVK